MTSQESALAVSQRVCARLHLAEVVIGANVYFSDKIQVVVKHLKEVPALLLSLRVYHRKVERNRADIESADEHRLVVLVRRLHSAALEPW